MIFFASSCGSEKIKFDPRWHRPDIVAMVLIDRDGNRIEMGSERMLNFACMHQDKIAELAEILTRARLPKSTKKHYLRMLNLHTLH